MSDKHALVYEIAKTVAGDLGFKAETLHTVRGHTVLFRKCEAPECAHARAILNRWHNAESYIEDPNFTKQFNTITGEFE